MTAVERSLYATMPAVSITGVRTFFIKSLLLVVCEGLKVEIILVNKYKKFLF